MKKTVVIAILLWLTCSNAFSADMKEISIDSCTFKITDYENWTDFLNLAKFLEKGDPETNRLQPLCKKLPNSSFTIYSSEGNPSEAFDAEINKCKFKVSVKEEDGAIVVYTEGFKKCMSGSNNSNGYNRYEIVNTSKSDGYTIWSLRCSDNTLAWVNNQSKHFFEYGGKSMGRAKTLEQAMDSACQ